jgi:hypothetical protein
MTQQASRRGAVEMGTVLMIAAFAVIAGFIYWLSGQAAAERALDIVEDSVAVEMDDDAYADAVPISASDIMLDASGYEGQLVRLEPQTVLSLVGQQGFTLDFPTGPFLVSLSDDLIADDLGLANGDVVRVTGRVTAMSPEIAAGWQAAGRLTEGERMVAEFAVHFIAAEAIEISSGAPASGAGA